MAGQQGRSDPKEAALAATRCRNPHPEQVTDPAFLASEFFDARDAVQVKYEMVRKVKADGAPVTAAAAAFGYSRPAYYEAASALERGGLDARYEQLRHAALHARAEAFPLGLGVLTRRGVTAWRQALASLAPAGRHAPGTSTAAPARQPGMHPAQAADLPAP